MLVYLLCCINRDGLSILYVYGIRVDKEVFRDSFFLCDFMGMQDERLALVL